jgi:hypothetical protein
MRKTLTICDLCERSQSELALNMLAMRTDWGEIHVCAGCFGKPVSLLVARVDDLEKRGQAQLEKERAERDAQRESGYADLMQAREVGLAKRDSTPTLRLTR